MAEAELIVDFPTATTNPRNNRSVYFADMVEMCIVPRLDDYEEAHGRDLWYDHSDYTRMRLARQDSVLHVREMISAGIPVRYSGTEDGDEDRLPNIDDCLIGIEHLLTPATVLEFIVCKLRCFRVVLAEQTRQRLIQFMNPSDCNGWDHTVAVASMTVTRRAAVRARNLGKLQRDTVSFLW